MDAAKTKGTAPLVEYDVARDQYIQIRFYSPAPGYYACCLQEVTAQQNSAARLNAVLDIFEGGFSIADWDRTGGFSLHYISDGLCRMLRVSHFKVSKALSKDIFSMVCPEDRARCRSMFVNSRIENTMLSDQFKMRTVDSQILVISVRGIVKCFGKKLRYYVSYTDVTEAHRARELLDQAIEGYDVSILGVEFRKPDGAAVHPFVPVPRRRRSGI